MDCFLGMVRSHPEKWEILPTNTSSGILMRKGIPESFPFVIIVSGGAGNGPLFAGYAADGLADAVVAGSAFAAPNAYALYETGKLLSKQGPGVLLLYNHFSGDFLNNDMANELLSMEGICVESVMATDDIASAWGEDRATRNGRCGIAILIKLAAACRERCLNLKRTAAILRAANERLTTLSMHVDIDTEKAYIGCGFSGEPPICICENTTKQNAVKICIGMLLNDLPPQTDEELFLLVNRLRMTSYPDSYIMADMAFQNLATHHQIRQMRVGAFSNIADRYGCDFSILRMNPEIAKLLDGTVVGDGFIL